MHFTRRGPSVTIGSDHKPGLFRRMRALADVDRPAQAGDFLTLDLAATLTLLIDTRSITHLEVPA